MFLDEYGICVCEVRQDHIEPAGVIENQADVERTHYAQIAPYWRYGKVRLPVMKYASTYKMLMNNWGHDRERLHVVQLSIVGGIQRYLSLCIQPCFPHGSRYAYRYCTHSPSPLFISAHLAVCTIKYVPASILKHSISFRKYSRNSALWESLIS